MQVVRKTIIKIKKAVGLLVVFLGVLSILSGMPDYLNPPIILILCLSVGYKLIFE